MRSCNAVFRTRQEGRGEPACQQLESSQTQTASCRATCSTRFDREQGRRMMSSWLSEREQRLVAGAEAASAATPIPTQIVSNGEYLPPPQSATQKRVEARLNEIADANAKRLVLNRRQFFRTSCGMAAAFVAMNEVYGGNVVQVTPAEAREPELAQARADGLAGQFIFDVQTHFVRDDFEHKELLDLAKFASEHWNKKLAEEGVASLGRY